MAAYLIGELIEVSDAAGMDKYRQGVPATLALYGGRFLARGGQVSVLEGGRAPARLVLIEVPTRERLQAWWDSPEYRPLKELRNRSSRMHLTVVDGV